MGEGFPIALLSSMPNIASSDFKTSVYSNQLCGRKSKKKRNKEKNAVRLEALINHFLEKKGFDSDVHQHGRFWNTLVQVQVWPFLDYRGDELKLLKLSTEVMSLVLNFIENGMQENNMKEQSEQAFKSVMILFGGGVVFKLKLSVRGFPCQHISPWLLRQHWGASVTQQWWGCFCVFTSF